MLFGHGWDPEENSGGFAAAHEQLGNNISLIFGYESSSSFFPMIVKANDHAEEGTSADAVEKVIRDMFTKLETRTR